MANFASGNVICGCTRKECDDSCDTYRRLGPKPMTNGDHIRQMSDKELATFLCRMYPAHNCGLCIAAEFCHEGHTGMIDWLGQEVSEHDQR